MDPAGLFYRQIWLMEETGWSWTELCATPARLVEEMVVRLSARNRYTREKNERKNLKSRQNQNRNNRNNRKKK